MGVVDWLQWMGVGLIKVRVGEVTLRLTNRHMQAIPCSALAPSELEITKGIVSIARAPYDLLVAGETQPFKDYAAKLAPRKPSPAVFLYDVFYTKLFELAPHLDLLVKSSIKARGRMLLSMILYMLNTTPPTKQKMVGMSELTARHAGYSCYPEHFEPVCQSLLYALGQCIGPEQWTTEVESSWKQMYSFCCYAMIPPLMDAIEKRGDKVAACECSNPSSPSQSGAEKSIANSSQRPRRNSVVEKAKFHQLGNSTTQEEVEHIVDVWERKAEE
ncbi:unnamed protein product [Chrysoparadoxa australica]